MSDLLIKNVRIVEPGKAITRGSVHVRNGQIAAMGQNVSGTNGATVVVDGEDRLLTPGLIDVHTHGVLEFLYFGGPEGIRGAAKILGRYGVTTVVPTLVPKYDEAWIEDLRSIAKALPSIRGTHIGGLHIEGPFMALGGAACPTLPGDMKLLERILEAGAGQISVMSVSPDTPGIIPVIERLRAENIIVFITHTRASVEQTDAALAAGATHATHFYDVFYAPPETEPGVRPVGVVEAVLANRRTTVDFIADGVHVHPTAIRAAVAAKGYEGVVLITDSNIGAGLPPGVFDTPWGFQVKVRDGDGARHAINNTLAGSALTMDRGISNLMRWLDLPPEQIWAMGTINPARVMGLAKKGRMEVGADADLVLWNDNYQPAKTWVKGEYTYEKEV